MQTESVVPLYAPLKTLTAATLQTARRHAVSGELMQAEQCYRQVLECEPHNVEALYRLALMLHQGRQLADDALPLIDVAISVQPGNPVLHSCRAMVLVDLNRQLDALESLATACCIHPDLDTLYNIGLLCAKLCCPAQAEVYARRLITDRPDWPAAHYLLVQALTALGSDSDDLDTHYAFLIKSDPLNSALRFARGLLQLKTGNYLPGWEAQEWRWDIEPVKSSRIACSQPRWAGGPLEGRRLLILGEQGFGDVLQFARYLPLLVEQGAQVTLRLDANRASLARLLRRIERLEVIIEPEQLPPFDLYCPLASLPYVFNTTPQTIPATPYLQVDSADVTVWRERLANLPRPWTGLCWAGSAEHDHNIRRSLPLCSGSQYHAERLMRERRISAVAARMAEVWNLDTLNEAAERDAAPALFTMEPLLRNRPGTFISLQIGPHAQDVHDLPDDLHSRFFAPLTKENDFYDTACLIHALDEVITVDTSVAHVTGALGQHGIVIKPAAPEWRWIEHLGRSAWYPSLKLVEQHAVAAPSSSYLHMP